MMLDNVVVVFFWPCHWFNCRRVHVFGLLHISHRLLCNMFSSFTKKPLPISMRAGITNQFWRKFSFKGRRQNDATFHCITFCFSSRIDSDCVRGSSHCSPMEQRICGCNVTTPVMLYRKLNQSKYPAFVKVNLTWSNKKFYIINWKIGHYAFTLNTSSMFWYLKCISTLCNYCFHIKLEWTITHRLQSFQRRGGNHGNSTEYELPSQCLCWCIYSHCLHGETDVCTAG